jgi:hypothetical protein
MATTITTTKEFKQDLLFNIAKTILGLNTSNVCLPTTNDLVVQGDDEKIFLMNGKYYLVLFNKEDLLIALEKKLAVSLDVVLKDFKSYPAESFGCFYEFVLEVLKEQLEEVEESYVGRIEMLRKRFENSGQPLNLSAEEEKAAQTFKEKSGEVINYLSDCFLSEDSKVLKNLQKLSLPYNKWMAILTSRLAKTLSYWMMELSLTENISKGSGIVRFTVSTSGDYQELSLLDGNPLNDILEFYSIWKAKIRLFVDYPDADYPFESQLTLSPEDLLNNKTKMMEILEGLPQ